MKSLRHPLPVEGRCLRDGHGQDQQGKIIQRDAGSNILAGTSAMNAYCINTLGNFNGCGACHIGLGLSRPQYKQGGISICLLVVAVGSAEADMHAPQPLKLPRY